MTNTYPETATLAEKTFQEIRCLRMVMERLLNHLNSGLFRDYQMEKFGSGYVQDRE